MRRNGRRDDDGGQSQDYIAIDRLPIKKRNICRFVTQSCMTLPYNERAPIQQAKVSKIFRVGPKKPLLPISVSHEDNSFIAKKNISVALLNKF